MSRVRENRTHGSMGGERKPTTVGNAARRQAPLAYPTNLALGQAPPIRRCSQAHTIVKRFRRKLDDPRLARVRLGAGTTGRNLTWLGRSARSRLPRPRRSHPRSRSDRRRPRAASNHSGQPGTRVQTGALDGAVLSRTPTGSRGSSVRLGLPTKPSTSRGALTRRQSRSCSRASQTRSRSRRRP